MNIEEMAEKIFEAVEGWGPAASFVDIVRECGKEAEGDFQFSLPGRPNTILWSGVSQLFIDALFSDGLRKRILPVPCGEFIYLMDGGHLTLPIAKRPSPKHDYKTPHWAPCIFRVREKEAA
jgi:hypothetical protein